MNGNNPPIAQASEREKVNASGAQLSIACGLHQPPEGYIEAANKYLWSYSTSSTASLQPAPKRKHFHFEFNDSSYKKNQKDLYSMILPSQNHETKFNCQAACQTSSNLTFLPHASSSPRNPLTNNNISPLDLDENGYHYTFPCERGSSPQDLVSMFSQTLKCVAASVKVSFRFISRTLRETKDHQAKIYCSLSMLMIIVAVINSPYQQSIIRERSIATHITKEGISDHDALNFATSPQSQALQWIAHVDPMGLNESDSNLYIRYGLAVFYYSMNTFFNTKEDLIDHENYDDHDWAKNTWLTGESVCEWHGVLCETHNDFVVEKYNPPTVVGLNLTNIKGYLPKEISVLTNLKWIHLDKGNEISGTIPTEIGLLTNLMVLSLGNNNLSGSIPSEITSIGSSLKLLGLENNHLHSTIPKDIGYYLPDLVALYLDRNNLSGQIPSSIGSGGSTTPLSISNRDSSSIVDLRLNDNKLTGTIPLEISNLGQLQKLHLEGNQLSGTVPYNLLSNDHLSRLRFINLRGNKIVDQIPENICNKILMSKKLLTTRQQQLQIYVDCEMIICSCCNCVKNVTYEGR